VEPIIRPGAALEPGPPAGEPQRPQAPARAEPGGGERFRALFEDAPVGVALSEPDGRFTSVNRTLRGLLAGSGIDLDRGGLADLARHLPERGEQASAWREGVAAVRAGRSPAAGVDLPVGMLGGEPRWLRATCALVVLGGRRYLLTLIEATSGRCSTDGRGGQPASHGGFADLADQVLLAGRLQAALARSMSGGLPIGVLNLQVDDLARVDERLGRQLADAVLRAVTRRLRATLRAGDTVGRIGGGEFLVVALDVIDQAGLGALVSRVRAVVAEPMDLAQTRLSVSVSVGAYLAVAGDTLSTVMRRAEEARSRCRRGLGSAPPVDLDAAWPSLLPDDPSAADRPN
jgi:diguanylate cyclase (GGDEF)-like protein